MANWEMSAAELYMIKWWLENGYAAKLEKQFISQSLFQVSKDGYTMRFAVDNNGKKKIDKSCKKWASTFQRFWDGFIECEQLKEKAKEQGVIK